MTLNHPQKFSMSKGLGSRCKSNFSRWVADKILRGKRLNQSSLAIAAGTDRHTLNHVRAPTRYDNVDRALLPGVLPRRCATLHGIRHVRQLSLSLCLGQWTDLFLKQFFSRRHVLHDLPIQKPAQRPDIRHLGMVLE